MSLDRETAKELFLAAHDARVEIREATDGCGCTLCKSKPGKKKYFDEPGIIAGQKAIAAVFADWRKRVIQAIHNNPPVKRSDVGKTFNESDHPRDSHHQKFVDKDQSSGISEGKTDNEDQSDNSGTGVAQAAHNRRAFAIARYVEQGAPADQGVGRSSPEIVRQSEALVKLAEQHGLFLPHGYLSQFTQVHGTTGGGEFRSQTDTPEFKRWFGDSKVVDKDGKPLVVYHGTDKDFSEFSLKHGGESTGSSSGREGFFFAEHPKTAETYPARQYFGQLIPKTGANTMPVYLSMQKPEVFDNVPTPLAETAKDLAIELAKKHGSDGVIFRNVSDSQLGKGKKGDIYFVFSPTQIKSAIGNSGKFDPQDADITKAFDPSQERDKDGRWTAYHGTAREFKVFSKDAPSIHWDGEPGFFFTADKGSAADYAENASEMMYQASYRPGVGRTRNPPRVIEAKLSMKNPYTETEVGRAGDWIDQNFDDNYVKWLKDNGHDGVIVRGYDETNYIVLNPKQIRITNSTDITKSWNPNQPRDEEGRFANLPIELAYSTETPSPEKVNRFKAEMEDGAEFPPIDVRPLGNGKFHVEDGNHRLQAVWELGRKTIPAIIHTADDDILKANESPATNHPRLSAVKKFWNRLRKAWGDDTEEIDPDDLDPDEIADGMGDEEFDPAEYDFDVEAILQEAFPDAGAAAIKELAEAMMVAQMEGTETGISLAGEQLGLDPEDIAAAIKEPLRQAMEEYALQFSESTWARVDSGIADMLVDGLVDGLAPKEMGEIIESYYDGLESWEALRIARTEFARGQVRAALTSFDEEGIKLCQVLVSPDCCAVCDGFADRIWPIDQMFDVFPFHCHCRCSVLPKYELEDGEEVETEPPTNLFDDPDLRKDPWPTIEQERAEKESATAMVEAGGVGKAIATGEASSATEVRKIYNPAESRDKSGKWTEKIASVGFEYQGQVYRGQPGEIHAIALSRLMDEGKLSETEAVAIFSDDSHSGFITTGGHFINRDEAMRKFGQRKSEGIKAIGLMKSREDVSEFIRKYNEEEPRDEHGRWETMGEMYKPLGAVAFKVDGKVYPGQRGESHGLLEQRLKNEGVTGIDWGKMNDTGYWTQMGFVDQDGNWISREDAERKLRMDAESGELMRFGAMLSKSDDGLEFIAKFNKHHDAKTGRFAPAFGLHNEAKITTISEGSEPASPAKRDLTNTAEFKQWFGRSVVTADGSPGGKPLPVYHGSKAEFSAFDLDKAGSNNDTGMWGTGFYFSPDRKMSLGYGDKLKRVYVSLQNPFIIRGNTTEFRQKYGDIGTTHGGAGKVASDVRRERLLADGYDGVMQYEPTDKGLKLGQVVAFHPNQIKSVFNRHPTGDPDISKAWDESSHPREPKGEPQGGEFAHDVNAQVNYPAFEGHPERDDYRDSGGWGLKIGAAERMAQMKKLVRTKGGFLGDKPPCELLASQGKMDEAVKDFKWAWGDSASGPMQAMAQKIVAETYGGAVWSRGLPVMEISQPMRDVVKALFEDAKKGAADLPEEITVYRGVKSGVAARNALESWSVDKDCAARFDGAGIFKATVPRSAVFMDRRSDSEYEKELVLIGGMIKNIEHLPPEKSKLGTVGYDPLAKVKSTRIGDITVITPESAADRRELQRLAGMGQVDIGHEYETGAIVAKRDFDESAHPREPKGSEKGGEFVSLNLGATVDGVLPATPENISDAKSFVFEKWKERAKERGREEPSDLTDACKFASMFARQIFGGKLQGNHDHQYVVKDGQRIDLTDAAGITSDPYKHDKKFWGNREHKESLESNMPRVNKWIQEFTEARGISKASERGSANLPRLSSIAKRDASKLSASCVMAMLEPADAVDFLEFGSEIPDAELYREGDDFGREVDSHATCLMGIDKTVTLDEVRAITDKFKPFYIICGRAQVFGNNPDRDCLVIPVWGSQLSKLNRKLKALPFENDYPRFVGHIAIAYTLKGAADKFIGDDRVNGRPILLKNLVFSHPDHGKTVIPLGPVAKAYDPDEERDAHGRWVESGGTGGASEQEPAVSVDTSSIAWQKWSNDSEARVLGSVGVLPSYDPAIPKGDRPSYNFAIAEAAEKAGLVDYLKAHAPIKVLAVGNDWAGLYNMHLSADADASLPYKNPKEIPGCHIWNSDDPKHPYGEIYLLRNLITYGGGDLRPFEQFSTVCSAQNTRQLVMMSAVHEFAHQVWETSSSEIRDVIHGAWKLYGDSTSWSERLKLKPITKYAVSPEQEWFAETHAAYILWPDVLKKEDRFAYDKIREIRLALGLKM